MRVIILGLGVQGHKRRAIAGSECVGVVDPVNSEADFKAVQEVPLEHYEAALVCTPDAAKTEVLRFLLGHGKHVLVEKPLLGASLVELHELKALALNHGVTCYTAYNHRFEPHFVRMKQVIESGRLGQIYSARLFYGNGTARLVRDSVWRDSGAGVLPDLGSHLLDTVLFWFGALDAPLRMVTVNRFENQAPDHCMFGAHGCFSLQAEMTLLSWRNTFSADILAESGSAHIESLCKWGPATFTVRDRKLPSGRPDEQSVTLVEPDPTWQLEYDHFKALCQTGAGNIDNDIWIQQQLDQLVHEVNQETA